jgi:hypothetical protein
MVESGSWRYYGEVISIGIGDEPKDLLLRCRDRRIFSSGEEEEVAEWPYNVYFSEAAIDNVSILQFRPDRPSTIKRLFQRIN